MSSALHQLRFIIGFYPVRTGACADRQQQRHVQRGVQAVKDKNFRHAVTLFSLQADNNQHDAQYNLALLLEAGKGAPQDFVGALTWAWAAQLGGIEAAEELADELAGYLPEAAISDVRDAVAARLQDRIDSGDARAIPQFAAYHITMLEEADHETAYIWYSIAAALGLDGALDARDEARDNVEDERIVDLRWKLARFMKAWT